MSSDCLAQVNKSLSSLNETIKVDLCNQMFAAQYAQKQVQIDLKELVKRPDSPEKSAESKIYITALMAFLRHEEPNSNFCKLVHEWLSQLMTFLLNNANFNDRLYILNHVLRCSGGISHWATGFVQCQSPIEASDAEGAAEALNHALTVIHTILSPIK